MKQNTQNHPLFFPNLDSLRFLAFFYVFIFHCRFLIPHGKEIGFPVKLFFFLSKNGATGVNFFFVLSGFLISFLLLQEEQLYGKIHVGLFYRRRILRIWPLYYLTLLIGFVVSPLLLRFAGNPISEPASPLAYIFFLGNFNIISSGPPHSGALRVLWSVAVEEQFYLLWPLLLIAFKRYRLGLFLALIISSLIFRACYINRDEMLAYHPLSLAGDFAVGGILAWICLRSYQPATVSVRYYKLASGLLYASVLILLLFNDRIFYRPALIVPGRLIMDVLFGLLLFDQVYIRRPLFQLPPAGLFSKWGKYSYGLYCLHIMVLAGTLKLLEIFVPAGSRSFAVSIWIVPVGFSFSLLLAWLSFRFFESPFLSLKKRYSPAAGGSKKIPPENQGEQNN